ncbi:MAG: DUF368 domain-containing protein, partial [Defluviitaleaceae bacterium]|nr:DUF368 domain-containing protein [Defluviitaleaceae bacterium]
IRNFFCGLAFGITETIPGVSGGTVALILGFYGELIHSINNFRKEPKKTLGFVVPLLLGVASGILLLGSFISFLLANFSFPTMLFFIGLISGVIPHIFKKTNKPGETFKPGAKDLALFLLPALLLALASHLGESGAAGPAEQFGGVGPAKMLFIFAGGVVAAAALIIPGVSGSFVLLMLGLYPLALYSVKMAGSFLSDFKNLELFADICAVLVPLAAGVLLGGLAMARFIERLLGRHGKIVYTVILGLLAGSLYALFRNPITYQSGISAPAIVFGVFTFAAGAFASFFIGRKRL